MTMENRTKKADHVAENKLKLHREFYIGLLVVVAIVAVTYIETHIPSISGDIPIPTNIFVFGLININIVLLLFLLFLVLRNTVKMFYESKRNPMGSKLRTKLVLSFVGLTIVPMLILFFIVIGFINRSIDSFFDISIEQSLKESLEGAQAYYRDTSTQLVTDSEKMAAKVASWSLFEGNESLQTYTETSLLTESLSSVDVFSIGGENIAHAMSKKVNKTMVPAPPLLMVAEAFKGRAFSDVETHPTGDVIRAYAPVFSKNGENVRGAVTVGYYVPSKINYKMKEIAGAFEEYKQLKLFKNPTKTTYFTILLLITLLILFFAIWIGRYLAKEITGPIFELAEGTHEVASGNLDYRIDVVSNDEVGQLVRSFNRMTEDLKEGKNMLEEVNFNLRSTNTELDQRRKYIEIVMSNIPAGVISVNRDGEITSINRVGAEILGTDIKSAIGKDYEKVLRPAEKDVLKDMFSEMNALGAETLERQIVAEIDGRPITILVNLNALKDEDGEYIGMVAVLDDLTHILKTQRMAAWKEVARRIAHEIKNPLTPIRLSAQRLRKKFSGKLPSDEAVFDDCTKTIVKQVDELKTLVNEFSSFARMPESYPTPNDLNELVDETVALYRAGHRRVEFLVKTDPMLPIIDVDRDQMKRVLINLIDNSIAAMDEDNGEKGTITVKTSLDMEMKVARLEVADTGSGIGEEDKSRLFEPYFSTKKSGTGLGLSIVSTIVTDHNGYVRVKNNKPVGTRFIIELPVKAVSI